MDRRNFITTVPAVIAGIVSMAGVQAEEAELIEIQSFQSTDNRTHNQIIHDRWERTGILQSTPEHLKETLAVILENQRLQNEQWFDTTESCAWKRISIPVLVRAFNALNHDKFKVISICDSEDETRPEARWFAEGFWNKDINQKFRSLKQHNLDHEGEKCIEIAAKLAESLNSLMATFPEHILCLYCCEIMNARESTLLNYINQDNLYVYYRLIPDFHGIS